MVCLSTMLLLVVLKVRFFFKKKLASLRVPCNLLMNYRVFLILVRESYSW